MCHAFQQTFKPSGTSTVSRPMPTTIVTELKKKKKYTLTYFSRKPLLYRYEILCAIHLCFFDWKEIVSLYAVRHYCFLMQPWGMSRRRDD